MQTFSLQSGSNGNSIFVQAGETGLLIDAGISGRQLKLRLAAHGKSVSDIHAVLITHDHNDHARHAGVYDRLFSIPTYITRKTHEHVRSILGKTRYTREFVAGQSFCIQDTAVHTIPTPHDAVDGVIFVIEHKDRRLGIFTDLGHPFSALGPLLANVDAAYLESNYDEQMLETGPYPPMLKARIRGSGGHISNFEAAELLADCNRRPQWIALAHLSNENNSPQLALQTHRDRLGSDYPLWVASRYEPSELYTVD
jgi:phosphoribosyl 1,2-cyclic phosphodiesterase